MLHKIAPYTLPAVGPRVLFSVRVRMDDGPVCALFSSSLQAVKGKHGHVVSKAYANVAVPHSVLISFARSQAIDSDCVQRRWDRHPVDHGAQ